MHNRLIEDVLAAWREAERLAEHAESAQDRDLAVVAAARLRELYQELERQPAHPSPSPSASELAESSPFVSAGEPGRT